MQGARHAQEEGFVAVGFAHGVGDGGDAGPDTPGRKVEAAPSPLSWLTGFRALSCRRTRMRKFGAGLKAAGRRFYFAAMIILTDNGSLAPAATLALRELAAKVAARVGEPVFPVSLLHSSGIEPEKLDGVPAEILEPFLAKQLSAGETKFRILPLFFGPSLAITDYLPKRLAALKEKFPEAEFEIVLCLCDDLGGERLIAGILERAVRATLSVVSQSCCDHPEHRLARGPQQDCGTTKNPAVILVDHGSPARAVTDVRDRLADELRIRLGDTVSGVLAASMERREGDEYAFNEPLLATALRTPGYDSGEVVVAMQFLLPGRHAGPGGDVARIVAEAVAERPGLRVTMTGLVAEDDALADLLAARVRL